MKRFARRKLLLILITVAIAIGAWQVSRAVTGSVSAVCYGNLNGTPYPSGLNSLSLFSSTTAAQLTPTGIGVQLDTGIAQLDPQKIILPFDQDVKVSFVSEAAFGDQMMGWFYYDNVKPFLDASGALIDNDADGIPDFFQTASSTRATGNIDGLFHITGGNPLPDVLTSPFTDGGAYPYVPNLLESFTQPGKGGWIFLQCDDDYDLYRGSCSSTPSACTMSPDVFEIPQPDVSTNVDNIPDYDVNGDGVIDAKDRTVDLGIIQGGREIVFFIINFSADRTAPRSMYGLTGGGTVTTNIEPFFTKDILNLDRGVQPTGTVLQQIALKCAANDSSCFAPLGASAGWLTASTIAALNTAPYNNLLLNDNTVVSVTIGAGGAKSIPHFVVGAPQSDPNRWILGLDNGFETLTGRGGEGVQSNSGQCGAAPLPACCGFGANPGCSSDADYNDVVFLIERTNGGEVVSNLISSDIPQPPPPNVVISKIRLDYHVTVPAGCAGVPNAGINIYYSVDNKATWQLAANVSSSTSTDVVQVIDVLGQGLSGNQLYWKADFVSASQLCQPTLDKLDVGYEAVEHGDFKFGAAIPLANVVFTGSLETPVFPVPPEPAVTNNDNAPRGHLRSERLYDPATLQTALALEWDAGQMMASTADPDSRRIYTNIGGTLTPVDLAHAATLEPLLVPPTSYTTKLTSGLYAYSFTQLGNAVATTADADFVIQWVRGWENSSAVPMTPPQSPLKRAWPMGAAHNSSPAIISAPPRPLWIDGSAAPPTYVVAHNTFQTANATRATVALIGTQDGMLHAFNAGNFRSSSDPACATFTRGCFIGATDAQRYGDGSEAWAWVPPSQLGGLANNHPQVRGQILSGGLTNSSAEVDGSVSAEDIFVGGTFRTVAFASLGRVQKYVTAVDVSSATAPAVFWSGGDWSDVDFNGTELSPSIALSERSGGQFLAIVTSGLAAAPANEYVYLIDAATGSTIPSGKIQLNGGANAAMDKGFAGYPNLVDSDNNGLVDRVYSIDTSGRLFKYDITSGQHCRITSTLLTGTTTETVYSGMSALVYTSPPRVALYFGGAPNPDGSDVSAPPYHFWAFEDDDPLGACTEGNAKKIYSAVIPNNEKLWAAPFVAGDQVYYATAGAPKLGICDSASGYLYALSVQGDASYLPVGGVPSSPNALTGSPASSLRVYDGHALVNTVAGMTAIIGGSGWNNSPTGVSGGTPNSQIQSLNSLLWQEN